MSETRQQTEMRYKREYEEYLAQCEKDKVEPLSWMNWQYNRKLEEKSV